MRLLLVDDEIRLLEGLRRSLRLERPEWHVATAASGTEAFQKIQSEEPFDMLITDMLMPGMDGSALLRESQRVAPGMVRIILSGHAGIELIQSCEASFHQFLAKPVDPDRFIALVDSFAAKEDTPSMSRARQLVAGLDRVPSLPSLHRGLSCLLREGHPSIEEVLAIVRLDMGMATKILKLVNSSYLTLAAKVTDLTQALELISLDLLKQAVLERGAMTAAQSLHPSGLDLAELWEHSAQVAQMASLLAAAEQVGQEEASHCYTAGLLHDVGRVVMALDPSLDYHRVLSESRRLDAPSPLLELEAYGTTHAEVGAELLHLWGLDPRLCDLVAGHHGRIHCTCGSIPNCILKCADLWSSSQASENPFSDGYTPPGDEPQPCLARWMPVLGGHAQGLSADH